MSRADETFLDLSLSRSTVDRNAAARARESTVPQALADPRTLVLALCEGSAAVRGGTLDLRAPEAVDASRDPWFLGSGEAGEPYLAVTLPPGTAPAPGARWVSLREIGADLPDRDAGLLTAATALDQWHLRHQHCPRCGARTEVALGGWVRRCPQDSSEHHPRTDPAVIMAVRDTSDRILLGTGNGWPAGRFSCLAGFVEAGEALEAAVAREVLEEVGVRLDPATLRYRGNQPWPFPASLMLGFTAVASTTDLHPDPTELQTARWFTRDELAAEVAAGRVSLPPRVSIARHLIEDWFGGRIVEPVGGDAG